MLRHRYSLPIISGVLLALVFFPFYLWPLAFVALVPFFYFAGAPGLSRKETFLGGFIAGSIGIGPTVYSSLFKLNILAGSETFSYLVRASALPVLFMVACAFGLIAVLYSMLRAHAPQSSAFAGAALYGIYEMCAFRAFSGYYLPSLSYAVVSFPGALLVSSLGGSSLVSFAVAWLNSAFAEALRSQGARRYAYAALAPALPCALVCAALALSPRPLPAPQTISAAVIQEPYANPQSAVYGSYKNEKFSHPALASLIENASDANFILYPFAPFRGAAYDEASSSKLNPNAAVPDKAVGEWIAGIPGTGASTTVLVWESALRSGQLFDQYALWQGINESTYTKRVRYPLSDYAPAWTAPWGLYGHTYTIEPGDPDNQPSVSGTAFGGLICSELHQSSLVRQEATRSPFIVAIGSDAMFPGDLMGNYSLAAARYRAAENATAIVRGNMNGPSAFINPDGSIQSSLGFGKRGILRGTLPLAMHMRTPYSNWGDFLVWVLAALFLATALIPKKITAR